MPDAKPMSPERLAAMELLLCLPACDASDGLRQGVSELLAEVRRLQSALDLSARHTPFSSEPCPLCLLVGGTCAMHRHHDEQSATVERLAKERDALREEASARFQAGCPAIESEGCRIATLETALGEAINWIADRSAPDSLLVERLRAVLESK